MRASRIFPAVSVAALMALAGCNQNPNTTAAATPNGTMAALAMPLTTGPETPVAPAPPVSALPRARTPVRVVHVTRPQDNYAYVDRAYAMSDAFGDAPPDYGYDYGPTHLWAWRGHDRSVRLVEPIDGGDRDYYYRPGRDVPYLVRDYDNSYGYDDDGDLVVVYDRDGRPLPYPDRFADRAARELARARAVYAASLNSERHEVRAANWAARRSQIDAARADWAAQAAREAEWRAYHDEHAAETAAYWQGERDARAREAQAFTDWQRHDYRTPLPAAIGDRRGFDPAALQRQQQQAAAQQHQRDQMVMQARLDQQRADLQTQQHQQLAAQQASLQAHQQAEARLAALKQQQQAQAEEARRKQLGAQQASQQASAQAHQQAVARLAALKQQQQAQAEEARRKQLGAQQASQQASAQAHQQAVARLAALKQQQQAQAEEARRKQLGAQQASQQAHQQALARLEAATQQQHAETEARRRQQLAEQQAQKEKVLAAQNQAHQQAVARQQAAAHQKAQAHGQDHHPRKPGDRHDDKHGERQ
jgi:hypothetical protein